VEQLLERHAGLPLLDMMMLVDQQTYLADDLLAKVDRASMAVSLEARVPLLDHRVVEFSWRVPRRMKIRDGRGKWLLRQVLYRYVEPRIVDRPKVGFSVPLAAWLRGPLRDWASELLLSSPATPREHALDAARVRQLWTRLAAGEDAAAVPIWALLMLASWRIRWSV
jgi:asparagine synthase (glutamine-hydrolysing)